MALLGNDFNVAQPGDTSLAKHGARWLRDTKDRLKKFAQAMFDPDTGLLKDNAVQSRMLANQQLSAGTWNEVTVNTKGLVTSGVRRVADTSKQKQYVAIYGAPANAQPGGFLRYDHTAGAWITGTPNAPDGERVVRYSFAVPAGVSRITAHLFGSSGGGGHAADIKDAGGGAGGGYVRATMEVSPGSNVPIGVGYYGVHGALGVDYGAGTAGATTTVGSGQSMVTILGGGPGNLDEVGVPSIPTSVGSGIYITASLLGQPGSFGRLDTNHYPGAGGYGAAFTYPAPRGVYGLFQDQAGGRGDGGGSPIAGNEANVDGDSGLVIIEYIA